MRNSKVSTLDIDLSTFKQNCSDEQNGLYYKVKRMEEKVKSDEHEPDILPVDPKFNNDVRESLATTELKIEEINATSKKLLIPIIGANERNKEHSLQPYCEYGSI